MLEARGRTRAPPEGYQAAGLVERDYEMVEETVLPEDAGHLARQSREPDHCLVANRSDPDA